MLSLVLRISQMHHQYHICKQDRKNITEVIGQLFWLSNYYYYH